MIQRLSVYRTSETDPYKNLAVEQYLLERVGEGEVILYLWQNSRTVVIGRNQNPYQECSPPRLVSAGVNLARRLSGGGAVFHDMGNLNFTFLAQKANYSVSRQLSVIVDACKALGIPAQCTGRNDVVSGDRKFSGNAFYSHNQRCYHHGTLLVDADMGLMSKYLTPSAAKLRSKGVSSVRSRVVNLREMREGLTVEELAEQMERSFAAQYGPEPVRLDGSDFDWDAIGVLTERNESWEWLYGRSSDSSTFSYQCSRRFGWGELTLEFFTDHGIVTRLSAFSDSMDWRVCSELERVMTGQFFRAANLHSRVMGADLDGQIKQDICALLSEI